MDDNADPFINQGGEQAYNGAFQYIKGAYSQDYECPHIADSRLMAAPAAMMVSRGMKWE